MPPIGQIAINPRGQPAAFAGLVSANFPSELISAFSEEASAAIPFGVAVKQGTALQGAKIMTSSADVVKGIIAFDYTHAPGPFGDLLSAGLAPKAQLKVLRKGRIWVVIDPNLASVLPYSDRGWVRYSANGGQTQPGAWGKATDAGHNTDFSNIAVYTGQYQVSSDGTNIAELEVDFTNKP